MFFSYVDFVRFRALSCADFSPEQNASFWWPWLMNLYDFEAPKMARSWESLTFLIDFEASSMVSAWLQLPFQEICSRVLATLFVHFRALSCAFVRFGFCRFCRSRAANLFGFFNFCQNCGDGGCFFSNHGQPCG